MEKTFQRLLGLQRVAQVCVLQRVAAVMFSVHQVERHNARLERHLNRECSDESAVRDRICVSGLLTLCELQDLSAYNQRILAWRDAAQSERAVRSAASTAVAC